MSTPRRIPRIIYNDDSCTLRNVPTPHTLDSVSLSLDYLKGTQVDCLCWLMSTQIAYSWPSKVMENFYDLEAKGYPISDDWDMERNVMRTLHKQGIDYLPELIRRAQAQGLTFIASFRLNDTHHKTSPDSIFAPDFWRNNQEYRIWESTDAKSYFNCALDYSYPEVRNRYRDAIAEVAGQYDIDGIELDLTRNPYFFQPSEAYAKRDILTDFVREIRDLLAEIGTRRGRELTLIIRIPSQEEFLAPYGIDARGWMTEKLADIFVISEMANNYNMSLEPWLSLAQQSGVLLYPAVEVGPVCRQDEFYSPLVRNPLVPRHDGKVAFTPGEVVRSLRAAAQNLLAQGPDGIAIFNFPCHLAEEENFMHTARGIFCQMISILDEVGELDTVERKAKLYTYYRDLPVYVEANRPKKFHQTIPFSVRGGDIKAANGLLRFRQIAERNPHAMGNYRQPSVVKPGVLKYYLNDREIPPSALKFIKAPRGRIRSGFHLKTHEIVELQLTPGMLRDGENLLAFEMPHYPQARDPYVYIYELEVELSF